MGRVLLGNLGWHPAAAAWAEVAPNANVPEEIEELRRGKVYRLMGAADNGAPIIARRSGKALALLVRMIYERMLPHLPVAGPRYRAFRVEEPGTAWVFLEEVRRNGR
ncbi:MAG: hypothetical protein ACREMN_10090 [Gemmatimonadales bacterium]